jgi:hypothetical protein
VIPSAHFALIDLGRVDCATNWIAVSPEAIRQLLEQALAVATPTRSVKAESRRKAAKLAGQAIDALGDPNCNR